MKCAANQYTADAAPQNGERQTIAERIASEAGVSKNTIECAGQYARVVDTLAEALPTIKRKILSGEIPLPRATIVEIASKPEAERVRSMERMERGDQPEPEVKMKECRSCGRTLKLDQFSTQGMGRTASYCRQCRAMAKEMSDIRAAAREQMQIIKATASALYNDKGRPEYTIEDVLEEVRLGAEHFMNLVRNTYAHQPTLMGIAKNVEAVNALLEDIAGKIYNLRKA